MAHGTSGGFFQAGIRHGALGVDFGGKKLGVEKLRLQVSESQASCIMSSNFQVMHAQMMGRRYEGNDEASPFFYTGHNLTMINAVVANDFHLKQHICGPFNVSYPNTPRPLVDGPKSAKNHSSNRSRSCDLGVMSPARFLCAMLLKVRAALEHQERQDRHSRLMTKIGSR